MTTSRDAIRPLLRRIGLDEKEVDIYLALLPLKVAKAAQVAKAAGQSRSTAYLILRNLSGKGLVAEVERGKIIHFIAEPPDRLRQYIEDRERELHSLLPLIDGILPALSSLSKPLSGTPRVVMLKGNDGMRRLYRDALSKEICGIFNPATMYGYFGDNIVTMLFGKYVRLRGRDLLVPGPAANRYVKEVETDDEYAVRLLPKGKPFETDTICFGDTIAFFAYDDEQTIIRMENKNMADAFRSWFNILWSSSSPTTEI